MTDFSDLPISQGVGDYHLNRFRIAFRSTDPKVSATQLAADFIANFPFYFNGPAATVRPEEGRLKFYGNIPVGGHQMPTPHPDWVRYLVKNPTLGFTVQTQHRDSMAMDDLEAGSGGGAAGSLAGPLGILVGEAEAVRVNRYHFLAGRRAWRLDVASSFAAAGDRAKLGSDVIILETAAIERFSLKEYAMGESVMEPTIIDIWSHLLANFATKPGVAVLSPGEWPMEPGWTAKGQVHYVMLSFKTEAGLRGSSHYPDLIRLYPRIYEGAGR